MLVSGTAETLCAKWADRYLAQGTDAASADYCADSHNKNATVCRGHQFQHPFLQSELYFVGKVLCLLVFNILFFTIWREPTKRNNPDIVGNQNFNRLLLYPAALCKIGSSSTFYVGLNITYASSSQMFNGAGILFTALLSIIFLKARLYKFSWFGMVVVVVGLVIVGLNDVLSMAGKKSGEDDGGAASHKTTFYIILGDIFILSSKFFTAMECTYEQALLKGKNLQPLQVTGWEGVFGFMTVTILLIPLYFCYIGEPVSSLPSGRLEDVLDAFAQIRHKPVILAALACTVCATAISSAAEAAIVKMASATTSQVLNCVRASTIWMVSLALRWQTFGWLQVVGFILIIFGTLIYNELFIGPTLNERFGVTAFSSPMGRDALLPTADGDQSTSSAEVSTAENETTNNDLASRFNNRNLLLNNDEANEIAIVQS